jgi:hypothetical protein
MVCLGQLPTNVLERLCCPGYTVLAVSVYVLKTFPNFPPGKQLLSYLQFASRCIIHAWVATDFAITTETWVSV